MKKQIIVAASGYFDPIHIGHIEYLNLAKKQGDKLIVIVNNDDQAILKKGKPFMNENERMAIVRELKCVDEVFLSIDKDPSVCESLRKIKPDIFAKGRDRIVSNIPEVSVCKEIGCKIVDSLGEKIQSSSNLIENSRK